MSWEDVEHIFRPPGVHMGVMRADPAKCTRPRGSECSLCWENCLFRAWDDLEPGKAPKMKAEYECFSCYNCMVACPRGAISVVEPYHVDEGFWRTEPHKLEARPPAPPLDARSGPDEWTPVERAVYNRRSVRNFKENPVPETLLRRVLEAGRFAPSAGNCQPWRFIVVTDKALIREMDDAIWTAINTLYAMYRDDAAVKRIAAGYELSPQPGLWDPRLARGGMGMVVRKNLPPLLGAPAVILILGDERSIGGPQINVGICGQNMNLVCNSLGMKCCWVGFAGFINGVPPMLEKLGIAPPWSIITSLCIGYPRFKQEGIVPREYRPVTWFRGDGIPEID